MNITRKCISWGSSAEMDQMVRVKKVRGKHLRRIICARQNAIPPKEPQSHLGVGEHTRKVAVATFCGKPPGTGCFWSRENEQLVCGIDRIVQI